MTRNTCRAIEEIPSLTCQVCLDTWTNPIQLVPCRHIVCAKCAPLTMPACPLCKSVVEHRDFPPEQILQASALVHVKCGGCGWKGSRKASEAHRCGVKDTQSDYENFEQKSDEEVVRELRQILHGGNGTNQVPAMGRLAPLPQTEFPLEVREGIPLAKHPR